MLLRKRILQLFRGPSPTDTIYGEKAAAARREVLQVRLEHQRLQRAWLHAETDEARERIGKLMETELKKLEEIENRYFGRKDA